MIQPLIEEVVNKPPNGCADANITAALFRLCISKINELVEEANYVRSMVDPLERMQNNADMLGRVSVPEAEPQEHLSFLLALDRFQWALEYDVLKDTDRPLPKGPGISARDAKREVVAAAREYAQPGREATQALSKGQYSYAKAGGCWSNDAGNREHWVKLPKVSMTDV